jgi:cytochrome c oxidase subunit III
MSAAAAVVPLNRPPAALKECAPPQERRNGARARADLTQLGLLMFLGTVTMLFAAFTSAYIVRKGGTDWQDIPLPSILWFNTAVLALSSATLEAAWAAGFRQKWPLANRAFAASIALGLVFLGGQIVAWRDMAAAGQFLPSNPRSSFFYMLTGAHGVHVVAALAVLGWGAALTWGGRGRRDPFAWVSSMRLCRTFWHYLGAVWLFLFALVSLY